MASYKVGDTAELSFNITLQEIPTDPTFFDVAITFPSGSILHVTWPGDVTRPVQGTFIARFPVSEAGIWSVTATAVGEVEDVQTTEFDVEATPIMITLHTDDQTGLLPNVYVQVFSNPQTMIAAGTSDEFGNVTFRLLPGTYTLHAVKPKTVFPPLGLLVTGAGTHTIVGESLAITTPAVAQTVRLFGHVLHGDGRVASNTRVLVATWGSFVLPVVGADTGIDPSNLMVDCETRELRTDANGFWEVDVVAETTVRVDIPSNRFRTTFRVPSKVTTLNIRDARPDPGPGGSVGIDFDTPTREDAKGAG